MSVSRRGFLAGGIAVVGLPSVARAESHVTTAPWATAQQTTRLARALAVSPDGRRIAIAHAGRRSIEIRAGGRRVVDVGGQPMEIAMSPDKRLVAVTTGFWNEAPSLVIVRTATGKIVRRVEVGPAPADVAFTRDGKRLIVTGGEQEGHAFVIDAKTFKVVANQQIGLVPRGIGVHPEGKHAWVALNAESAVARINTRTGRVGRTLETPPHPDRVAVSPDGSRLLVSHGGPDAAQVSDIDVRSGRVRVREAGPLPSGVGWTRSGRPVVAVGGAGQIVVFGRRGRVRRRRVAGAPRGLVVRGSRAFSVDGLTAELRKVRL